MKHVANTLIKQIKKDIKHSCKCCEKSCERVDLKDFTDFMFYLLKECFMAMSLEEARKLICEKYKGDFNKALRDIASESVCNGLAAVLVGVDAATTATSTAITNAVEEFVKDPTPITCDCEEKEIKA